MKDEQAMQEARQEAIALARKLVTARDAAQRMEDARDAAIRRAASLGAHRDDLARDLHINRSRLFVILNEPDTEDPALWEWLDQQEAIAVERWEASGREGLPDDYWPATL